MYSSPWLFHRCVAGTAGKDSLKLCLASLADLKIAQFTSGVSADLTSSTQLNPEMTPCLQTAFENEWFVTWKCGGFYFIFNLCFLLYSTLWNCGGLLYTIQYTPAVLPTPLFLSQDFRHLFYQMNMNMKKRFHKIFRFPEVIREIRKNVCQLIRLLWWHQVGIILDYGDTMSAWLLTTSTLC